jgi:hypothetical protein
MWLVAYATGDVGSPGFEVQVIYTLEPVLTRSHSPRYHTVPLFALYIFTYLCLF